MINACHCVRVFHLTLERGWIGPAYKKLADPAVLWLFLLDSSSLWCELLADILWLTKQWCNPLPWVNGQCVIRVSGSSQRSTSHRGMKEICSLWMGILGNGEKARPLNLRIASSWELRQLDKSHSSSPTGAIQTSFVRSDPPTPHPINSILKCHASFLNILTLLSCVHLFCI